MNAGYTKFRASAHLAGKPEIKAIAARIEKGESPFRVWSDVLHLEKDEVCGALGISSRHFDELMRGRGPCPDAPAILRFCHLFGIHPVALAPDNPSSLHPHVMEAVVNVAFRDRGSPVRDRGIALRAIEKEYRRFGALDERSRAYFKAADEAWLLWEKEAANRESSAPEGSLAGVLDRCMRLPVRGDAGMRLQRLVLKMSTEMRAYGAEGDKYAEQARIHGRRMHNIGLRMFTDARSYNDCIEACRLFVNRHGFGRLADSLKGEFIEDNRESDDLSRLIHSSARTRIAPLGDGQYAGYPEMVGIFAEAYRVYSKNVFDGKRAVEKSEALEKDLYELQDWLENPDTRDFALPLYESLCLLTPGEKKRVQGIEARIERRKAPLSPQK